MALVSKTFGDIITFTRASTATYFDSTGTLQSAAIDAPRFDYNPSTLAAQGFLIEEARTNSIRNNTMQGAVAGTPGTVPTNWGTAGAGTLVQEIVGIGTDAGITYIDYRISGTTSTTAFSLFFEAQNQIVATSGQTWSTSFYVKLQAGSTTNITAARCSTRGNQGVTIRESSTTNFTPTAVFQRIVNTFTLADALTDRVNGFLGLVFASGVAIDITLRIGLPQLELGAFATSVIPTTTTALTRSADVASVNTLSPWFNATESTLYLEFTPVGLKSVGAQPFVSIDNGSNERIALLATSGNTLQNITTVGGTTSGSNVTPATTYAADTTYKVAAAVKLDDLQSFANGVAGTVDTTTLMPSGLTSLQFNKTFGGSVSSNGWLRRFTYYPRRLSQAEGEAITA